MSNTDTPNEAAASEEKRLTSEGLREHLQGMLDKCPDPSGAPTSEACPTCGKSRDYTFCSDFFHISTQGGDEPCATQEQSGMTPQSPSNGAPTSDPEAAPDFITQRLVDHIIQRAQNSAMGLGNPDKPNAYDLSNYDHPTFESLAILLISAHYDKYDLVSICCAAMEEVYKATKEQNEH